MNRINKHLASTPADSATPTPCDPELIDLALEAFRGPLHRMGVCPVVIIGCSDYVPEQPTKFVVLHPENFTTEQAIQTLQDAIESLRNTGSRRA